MTSLAAGLVERVEGVKELLLAARLALEELDVVDQQHVDVAEARLEVVEAAAASAARNCVGELLGGRVAHRQAAPKAAT